jgi:excisionase family DNA binding protein
MYNQTRSDLPPRPTVRQAAEYQGVDIKTIRRWIASVRLTAYRVSRWGRNAGKTTES